MDLQRMLHISSKFNKLALGVGLIFSSNLAYSMTLQDAVNQTLTSHPDILSAQEEQGAAKSDVSQAKGGWLPSFDVEAGIGHENTNNPATRATSGGDVNFTRQESNFVIRQLLFDGGNVSNQVREAKANYKTRVFQVSETEQLLGFQAAEAYLNVLRARELVTIAQFDVKAHEDLFQKVQKRLKAGAGRKSELQLADSRLALSMSELDRELGGLHDANDTYIKLVGSAPPKQLSMPKPPKNMPHSLQQAQQLAMQINPTVKATDMQIAANQAAKGVAKSTFLPTFTLDVSQSYNNNLDGVKGYNNEKLEMVRMTYNVFNGGSDKAAVDAATYRVAAAQHDSATTRRDTNENVALSWNNLQANLNRIPPLQTHVTQSYNVWQAYEKQFQLGQRTLFDLLNAQSEYYDARAALTDAEYSVRVARYRLLAAIGNFVATVENTNRNYISSTHHAQTKNKQIYGISQSSSATPSGTLTMSNQLATGTTSQMSTANPVNNYTYSPYSTSMSKAAKPSDPKSVKQYREKALKPLASNATINTTKSKVATKKTVKQAKVKKEITSSVIPVKTADVKSMDKYTIQLLVAVNKDWLNKFAHKTHITKQSQIFMMQNDKKAEYVLTYGSYKTKAAAEYGLNTLPKDVQKLKPFIRPTDKYILSTSNATQKTTT